MTNKSIGVSLFSIFVYFASSFPAVAAEPECGSVVECVCTSEKLADAQFFPTVRTQVLSIRKMLCMDNAPRVDIYRFFYNFVKSTNHRWFDKYGGFEGDTDPLEKVTEIIEGSANDDGFKVATVALNSRGVVDVNGSIYIPSDENKCPKNECRPVLREFTDLYNYAQVTLASASAVSVLKRLSSLGGQWDSYLDRSRSQTPLELLINSWNFQRKQTTDFAPPPDWQFIALHPGLVIENVEKAVDGEKTEEALMIELVGANRWRATKWYQPTGASVVALYSDRVGVDDVGYGVAIHFNSTYTVGFTDRDGVEGIFISIDLLKPLQDKKKSYAKYLSKQ